MPGFLVGSLYLVFRGVVKKQRKSLELILFWIFLAMIKALFFLVRLVSWGVESSGTHSHFALSVTEMIHTDPKR
jgi:hypothetical protein